MMDIQQDNQEVILKASKKPCVMIVAAGTGGHVFPALAVAEALISLSIPVVWIGTPSGFEVEVVKGAGIPFKAISVSGLRGKGLRGLVTAPFKIAQAISQSLNILEQDQPGLMLAMGGYVAGPAGVAAWMKKVPLIIHEQNAIPGLTNRWLSKLSEIVFSAFPNALSSHKDFRVVGNPLRASLIGAAKRIQSGGARVPVSDPARPLHLLVLGGSLGARTLNQWVPAALKQLEPGQRPEVWHQAGKQGYDDALNEYQRAEVAAKVVPFIDEMQEAYAWADFVICRAGAMTSSEVSAMGLPAIFVPYPYAVDDHQKANANHLVSIGAAQCLIEKESSSDQMREILSDLIHHPEKLDKMRQAALAQRQLDAVSSIVEVIEKRIGLEAV